MPNNHYGPETIASIVPSFQGVFLYQPFDTTVIPVQKSHQLNEMNNISDSEYDGMYVACSQHSQHIYIHSVCINIYIYIFICILYCIYNYNYVHIVSYSYIYCRCTNVCKHFQITVTSNFQKSDSNPILGPAPASGGSS
jgi:hypothetical protein